MASSRTTRSADVCRELGRVFRAHGYDEPRLRQALGVKPSDPLVINRLVDERRLETGPPLAGLIKLFVLGCPLDLEEAERAFFPVTVAETAKLGLVRQDGPQVIPKLRVMPFQRLLIAHDPDDAAPLVRDHVAGVGAASSTLAGLTVRRPVKKALDMGTGCGVQALLAAVHAERVVAVDINPRAIEIARLNDALNQVGDIDWREGDLLEPVSGERFDLVVANPPFVVSPDNDYIFRDGGAPADELSGRVVRQAANCLNEGGFAHVLCNWVRAVGEDWTVVPGRWVADAGCDAWILHYQTEDPLSYASKWNDWWRHRDPDHFRAALARWDAYFKEQSIEAIAGGAVILRRRAGRNWTRADEMPRAPFGSASDHILRVFARDHLAKTDDRVLLEGVYTLVDGHRLDQTMVYQGNAYTARGAELRLDNGVGLTGVVDPHVLNVLFRLNGQKALGDVIGQAAASGPLGLRTLERRTLETFRSLIALGFLEPQ